MQNSDNKNLKNLNINQIMDWINTMFNDSGWVFRTRIPSLVLHLQNLFPYASINGFLNKNGVGIILSQTKISKDKAFLLTKSFMDKSSKLQHYEVDQPNLENYAYAVTKKILFLKATCVFKENEIDIFIPFNFENIY